MTELPRIDHFEFGSVLIGGTVYRTDIVISRAGIRKEWRRKEGHRLIPQDLPELDGNIETLLVGTGVYGMMSVAPEVRIFCEKNYVRLLDKDTVQAVNIFNKEFLTGRTVFCLHITC